MSARGLVVSLLATATIFLATAARPDEEPPAPSPPSTSPPPAPPSRSVAPRVEGGYVFRRLFDLDFSGFDAAAGIQIDPNPGLGVFARARYGYGRSDGGLSLYALRLEGGVEARPTERFRIGGNFGFSHVWVPRATSGTLTKLGLGLGLIGSFDVVHADEVSLYLGLQAGAEIYPHFQKDWGISGVLLGAGPLVGVRF